MASKSLMTKCFQGRIFLQTHENSTLILPNSLINIEQLVDNNNIEDVKDICLVASQEVERGRKDGGTTPIVMTTGTMLLTSREEKIPCVQVQAEDNTLMVNNQEVSNDDELTSLSWLQNVDLLQNMKFLSNPPEAIRDQKIQTGGDLDSGSKLEPQLSTSLNSESESSWDGSNQSNPESFPNGTCQIDRPTSVRPRATAKSPSKLTKPPHSFSTLIFLAIESSSSKALPVREIYSWIIRHFPYYRFAPLGWKNSVRHNLSLNRSFCKYEDGPSVGKGSLWMVDPIYRPQLIQSLCKASFVEGDFLQRIIGDTPTDGITNKSSNSAEENSKSPAVKSTNRSNIPDPKLFPYLSRHLATNPSLIDSPDVDAATTMLALGQCHPFNPPLNPEVPQSQQWSPPSKKDYFARKNRPSSGPTNINTVRQTEVKNVRGDEIVASKSPMTIDDHTYSVSPRPTRSKNQSSNVQSEASRKLLFFMSSNDNPPEASSELEVTMNDESSLKRRRAGKMKRKHRGRVKDRIGSESKSR